MRTTIARMVARSRPLALSLALATVTGFGALAAVPETASAAPPVGTFKMKSTEVQEVSGAWHIYVTIELPKAPPTAHQPMRFLFTKTMVYERSLIDGHAEPVLNRQALQNQTPSVESLDVDFADPSGKIFKGTRFDFGLTRARGYEAGEYKVELRTSDGYTVGTTANLILKGDNPPVDRRAMAFSAKGKDIKKIDNYDAGAVQAKNDDPVQSAGGGGSGEVTPVGTATGFVPKEGMQETEEEKIKTRPRGCGCEVPGHGGPGTALFFLLPIAGVGIVSMRRRAARRAQNSDPRG